MKRPNRILFGFSIFALLTPIVASAQLVPCLGGRGDECQFCHFVLLIDNVVDWLVSILGVLAAIGFIYAGFKMVTAQGNAQAVGQAKSLITSLIIGYIIVLAGWLIIDTVMRVVLNDTNYGVWNTIQCESQPLTQEFSRTTATGANESQFSASDVQSAVNQIQAAGPVMDQAAAAAAAAGLDAEQTRLFQALIHQESSGCQNVVGPATRYGTAYGCGQLLLTTAQRLDPNATVDRLQNDDAYNLALSAQYFRQQVDQFGNRNALAAYNGGPGANRDSNDCPGLRAWECPWDSPGCYGTGRTDCERNEGFSSYEQTRNYVNNITNVAGGLR